MDSRQLPFKADYECKTTNEWRNDKSRNWHICSYISNTGCLLSVCFYSLLAQLVGKKLCCYIEFQRDNNKAKSISDPLLWVHCMPIICKWRSPAEGVVGSGYIGCTNTLLEIVHYKLTSYTLAYSLASQTLNNGCGMLDCTQPLQHYYISPNALSKP